MTPWTFQDIAETPIARLALELQDEYQFELSPHLAVEELALTIADRYELTPPVSFARARAFLLDLEVIVNPPGLRPLERGHHGNNSGTLDDGLWVVSTNPRDAETRQTLTLFHEFYEILRAYLHAFDCAPFPDGMKKDDYVPERMSRRFSAAITMPRPFMSAFLADQGLNIPLLLARTARSTGCVARRIRELLQDGEIEMRPVDFLAIRGALMPRLMFSDNPRMRIVEHVRSPGFSVRRRRRGYRDFHIPRTREEWKLGELVTTAIDSLQPVFAHQVTGYSLFPDRTLSALAVPEWDDEKERVEAVAIYATPAVEWPLWEKALVNMDCIELDRIIGLVGGLVKVPRRKTPEGEIIDTRFATIREKEVDVSVFRYRRSSDDLCGEDEDGRRYVRVPGVMIRLILRDDGQLEWDWRADFEDEDWNLNAA